MTLAPLFDAPFVIQIHALAAITAFAVGLVQLTAPKGTIPHRLIGWSWVMLMLTIAVSSLYGSPEISGPECTFYLGRG